MEDFLNFIDSVVKDIPMHIEIGYNKVADWGIHIYRVGMASKYPNSKHFGEDAIVCNVSNCDMQLAFAMAQCEVKEWLLKNEGGY